MGKLQQKKEQKKEMIIKAACDVFFNKGYLQTSMDNIAKQAGVTKQTVYRYFESKERLFQASLQAQREESNHRFPDELDQDDTRKALNDFAVGFIKAHMTDTHLAAMRLLVSEGPTAPELTRAYFALGPKETKERLTVFLQERFQLKDPEHEVDVLISILLSTRTGVLVGLHERPSAQEIADYARKTIDMFMKALS